MIFMRAIIICFIVKNELYYFVNFEGRLKMNNP